MNKTKHSIWHMWCMSQWNALQVPVRQVCHDSIPSAMDQCKSSFKKQKYTSDHIVVSLNRPIKKESGELQEKLQGTRFLFIQYV